MVVAAIVIGLVIAYYFGVKPGGYAAAVAAGLFVIATVVPPLATPIYVVVALGLIGVLLVGPRVQRPDSSRKYFRLARRTAMRWWRKW